MNEEAILLINEKIESKGRSKYRGPSFLYKYRTFNDYNFDSLKNDYLFLSAPKDLDDESECDAEVELRSLMNLNTESLNFYSVQLIVEYMKKYLKSDCNFTYAERLFYKCVRGRNVDGPTLLAAAYEAKQEDPNIDSSLLVNVIQQMNHLLQKTSFEQKIRALIELAPKMKTELGICSLAEFPNIQKMWERYADNHNGYCVEYDVSNYGHNDNIFKVIYDNNRDINAVRAVVFPFVGSCIETASRNHYKTDKSNYFKLFLSKFEKWSYQNEWRIVGDHDSKIQCPRVSKVIIGKNAELSMKNKLIDICKSKNIPYFSEN